MDESTVEDWKNSLRTVLEWYMATKKLGFSDKEIKEIAKYASKVAEKKGNEKQSI